MMTLIRLYFGNIMKSEYRSFALSTLQTFQWTCHKVLSNVYFLDICIFNTLMPSVQKMGPMQTSGAAFDLGLQILN